MTKKILLSVSGIGVGLIAISFIAESIEALIVSLQTKKSLSELSSRPEEYFAIRNQPLNILFKVIYNTFAAFVGGYLCCVIVKRLPIKHILILILFQIIGFVYGMTASEYSVLTPLWLWFILIIITSLGIFGGAYFYIKLTKKNLIIGQGN